MSMNDWIPVKERLPGEHISVLIYDCEREMAFVGYHLDGKWQYGDHYGSYDTLVQEGAITHWMPLLDLPDVLG